VRHRVASTHRPSSPTSLLLGAALAALPAAPCASAPSLGTLGLGTLGLLALGCGPTVAAGTVRSPVADKWLLRAREDFGAARVDAAHEAIQKALALSPSDPEVRVLAARIALARLEYDEALRMLNQLPGSEAMGLRGRAHWYRGDLSAAADELEEMLNDPEVRDEWAKEVAGLARRGEGRTPFSISGSLLATVEMAHVSPVVPYLVVPVEIDGEQGLAMLSTGMAEVVVDSATRAEPSWISLRFDERFEVGDVPALVQDLSGISRELNVPIKALLGVNLLRHLNVTIDHYGRQFVVRSYPAPAPPHATRVDLHYARGGGMLLDAQLGATEAARAALFVDSSLRFPMALDDAGWRKAGVEPAELRVVPGDPEQRLREGLVPSVKLGAFDLKRVPAVSGAGVDTLEQGLQLDIDGILGAPVLAAYRITLSDGGRMMWLEDETSLRMMFGDLAPAPGDETEGPAGPAEAQP